MSKKTEKLLTGPDDITHVVTVGSKKATREYEQEISNFGSLGKEIKISPKANITVNTPGYKVRYYVETVEVLIGIGKDHTASLVMTLDAWKALNAGEEIHITTNKAFKKKFL